MLSYELCIKNLTILGELYDKQISETMYKLYYELLKEMQDDDFKQSIRRLLSERVYPTFPKPAEILALSKAEKPQEVITDHTEEKAKELIELVHGMNGTIHQEHLRTGINFDKLLNAAKFPTVDEETIAILNNVRPHHNLKKLIAGINLYANTKDQIQAFRQAIKQSEKQGLAIDCRVKGLLKH